MHVQYPHVGHKYMCWLWEQKKKVEHDVGYNFGLKQHLMDLE